MNLTLQMLEAIACPPKRSSGVPLTQFLRSTGKYSEGTCVKGASMCIPVLRKQGYTVQKIAGRWFVSGA